MQLGWITWAPFWKRRPKPSKSTSWKRRPKSEKFLKRGLVFRRVWWQAMAYPLPAQSLASVRLPRPCSFSSLLLFLLLFLIIRSKCMIHITLQVRSPAVLLTDKWRSSERGAEIHISSRNIHSSSNSETHNCFFFSHSFRFMIIICVVILLVLVWSKFSPNFIEILVSCTLLMRSWSGIGASTMVLGQRFRYHRYVYSKTKPTIAISN